MNSERLCHSIAGTLPDLFECSPAPQEGVRVRTPLMYPDGGLVDVFVLEHGGQYRVTDFGETLGWLRMQSVSARRSPRQRRMIEDTCQTLGVELHRGQLVLRLGTVDVIAEAVVRLAQAAVRVSDLWFTLRTRAVETASDEVDEWLVEKADSVRTCRAGTGQIGAELDDRLSNPNPQPNLSRFPAEHRLAGGCAATCGTRPGRLRRSQSPESQSASIDARLSFRRHGRHLAGQRLWLGGAVLRGCPLVPAG